MTHDPNNGYSATNDTIRELWEAIGRIDSALEGQLTAAWQAPLVDPRLQQPIGLASAGVMALRQLTLAVEIVAMELRQINRRLNP